MGSDYFIKELNKNGQGISFDFLSLMKIPILVVLIANVVFALLLFLRSRILSDTFKTPQNKIVSTVVLFYVFTVVIGTLISLIFVILS